MTEPDVAVPAFLPGYLHLVPRPRIAARLGPLIGAASAPEHVNALIDQVWADLTRAAEGHAFRMLIGEFHDFRQRRGLPMDTGTDRALRLFREHLGDPANCAAILERYPVLTDRVGTVLRNALDAYAELFDAYARDRVVLHAAGLLRADSEPVTGLFGTGGDLHNGGRKVVGLELPGGARVVYKPRALVSDQFVRDLLVAAEEHLRHPLRDCLPTSVTVGSHGWQRYVTPAPMTAPDQPARYFYRFGALCALLGSIGASDLHEENVLAAGEHPCLIDTETAVRPNAGVHNDSLPHVLINQLKLSVAATMLVPMVDPNSRMDLMMAGIGVDGVQPSRMTRPVIRDGETDGISVRWENITYRHRHNVPRLGEAALSPVDHFTEITAGYLDALGAIRGDELGRVLDKYPDMPVRCLIRSTMVYTRFLDAATHPRYLADPAEARRMLGLLRSYPDYLSPAALDHVGTAERADLYAGDVPYFVARGGSTELATPTSSVPDVHRTAPLDFARAGLALGAARTDEFHRFLLEECLAEVVGDNPTALAGRGVFGPALAAARPRSWWRGIAEMIAAVAVEHAGPDGSQLGWVCGIGPDRNAPTLTPGNFISFHDLGGIVTFLDQAGRYDAGVAAAGAGARRGLTALLDEYGKVLIEIPESVFTGGASLLLTDPSAVDVEWLDRVLDKTAERVAAGSCETDLGNGPAGPLMVLLSRLAAGEAPVLGPDRLAWLTGLVRDHLTVPRTAPWFDVAHGELGLRWALARAGRVGDDAALVAASADWLVDRLAEPGPPVPGWCNGSAGLLLTAAEILPSAGRPELLAGSRLTRLVDEATRLPAGRPVDLSVCHGSSGVVQALIATARILDDSRLLDRAADHQERVIAAARAGGFHTGSPGRTSLLGYLLGWSGVGHTDLLLHAARAGAAGLTIPVALDPGLRPDAGTAGAGPIDAGTAGAGTIRAGAAGA
ncbi:type 2 lanthipeptide synthetase LanM [Plantactinospora siamensis]|uniref:Type 2 lanthipeptide synthetase LanM n=1 Tax=Plantactinospora siamensis TaxID=555372 RepID=A0ABV6NS14_9ACTN